MNGSFGVELLAVHSFVQNFGLLAAGVLVNAALAAHFLSLRDFSELAADAGQ